MLHQPFLSSLLSLLLLPATATALSINTTNLQPWQIPWLSTHSPSGYPANHPYLRIAFAVSDPNTIVLGSTHFGDAAFPPSSANCSVWWLDGTEDPTGAKPPSHPSSGSTSNGTEAAGHPWTNTCQDPSFSTAPIAGKWTFQILNGSTEAFALRVQLDEGVVLADGSVARLRWAGEAAFAVGPASEGGNMAGTCGGSGVCSWGLRAEDAPVLVRQTLVGVECVSGGCQDDGSGDS